VLTVVFDDDLSFILFTYALRRRAGGVFAFGLFKLAFFAIAPNPSCVETATLKGPRCKNWERQALKVVFAMEEE
jgi:hypothetical protein